MKVLLINGSPREEGCTNRALEEIAATLGKLGVESEIMHLGKGPIPGCAACGGCYKTGRCVFEDKVNEVVGRLDEFQGFVFGSPVYFAAPSGQIVSFLERFFRVAPNSKLAGKPGAAVVSCRRGGASAAFDRLNKFFAIASMPIATSQYWNQVHGNTPEEVEKDEEGLQTMRALARNMAWLMKCIEAGDKAGIERPVREKPIKTNYIR